MPIPGPIALARGPADLSAPAAPDYGSGGAGLWRAGSSAPIIARLLVARETSASFQVIDAFSRIVRLGEKLEATGALCEAAMEAAALEALRICAT